MNREKIIYIISGTLLFIYLLIRAMYVPFTHDEASTFFHYVQTGNLIPDYSREALNNHFLNTLLTYLSYILFGSIKFALRLPNVLCYIIYLVFVYKTSQFLDNKIYRWGYLAVLLFAHYFIEFFAVSRGYGISMAFFMAAFFYLMKAIKTLKIKNHVLVSLFGLLMVASNLNLVIPLIAILGLQLLTVIVYYKKIENRQRWMIPVFLFISVFTVTIAFFYLNELKEYDAFYYVAGGSFIEATIKTLIHLLTGKYTIIGLVITLILFVSLISAGFWLLNRIKINFLISSNSAFLFVFLASVTGILLAVKLVGVNFPEDRVAMYLFPLFIGSLFFTFDQIKGRYSYFLFLILMPLLFFPIHFAVIMNTSYVNGYRNEAIPERFFTTIAEEHQKSGEISTIGGANMRQFAWTYINYMNGGNENMVDWAGYPDTISLFQILETKNYPYSLEAYDSVDYAYNSGLTLYKRNRRFLKQKIAEITIQKTERIVDRNYYDLLKISADTVKHRQFYFEFNLYLKAEEVPFDAWLVLQVVNKNQRTLTYKFIPFNWLKPVWNERMNHFHQSIFLGPVPDDSDMIKIYIWNKSMIAFTLNMGKIEVFELE